MTLATDYFGHPERLVETLRRWRIALFRGGRLSAAKHDGWLAEAVDDMLVHQIASRYKYALPVLGMFLVFSVFAAGWRFGEPVPMGGLLVFGSLAVLATGVWSAGFYSRSERLTQFWRSGFIVCACIQGAGWALLAEEIASVLFVGSMHIAQMMTVALALLAIATSLPLRAAVHGLIWPIFCGQVLNVLMGADAINGVSSVFSLMMMAFTLFACDRLAVMMNARHSDRMEKDALIHALEEAKLHSDEARKRAEDLNLTKSRFLATVSHELRTPLNAILGFSEVMKDEMLGQHQVPSYREYANDIHRSGQLLLGIIDEVLDLSKIEAGRYDLKESLITLEATVTDCAHLLQMRAHQRDLSISLQISMSLPPLYADERAVRQITLNLLSNAIKFTPAGGDILVQVGQTEAGGHYISVSDTGYGIPANEIPLILESFGRGSLAIKAAEQGSGLGLPIVRGLIDLHQGEFAIQSREGEGTRVIVTFPPERAGKRHEMPIPAVITRIPAEAA